MRPWGKITVCLGVVINILMATNIPLADDKKPQSLQTQILSDSILSSGYVHSMAIADTLNKLPTFSISIKPIAKSTVRTEQLIQEAAGFCICDMESYFAQEGLLNFEQSDKGPAKLRILLSASSDFKLGLAIAKDSKATSITDLRGMRIPWIRNADQLNANMTAFLAFAGLGWEDVQKFTYPGYTEAVTGFERRQLDALIVSSTQPLFAKLKTGKRAFFLANFNVDQKISWRRMHSIAPYFQPSNQDGWSGVTHPYPLLLTTATQDTNDVYLLTKAISEKLEDITTTLPKAEGWHTSWQNFNWVMPFHDGAVAYFKEVGVWTDQAQLHQDMLITRQDVLAQAFLDFKAQDPDLKTFASEWRKYRMVRLQDAQIE